MQKIIWFACFRFTWRATIIRPEGKKVLKLCMPYITGKCNFQCKLTYLEPLKRLIWTMIITWSKAIICNSWFHNHSHSLLDFFGYYNNNNALTEKSHFQLYSIVGRGLLTPYFMKTPLHWLTSFFKFCPNPSPCALFAALFVCLNVSSCHI